MRRPSPRPRRSGFTLVELMVVAVIIAILVALLVPAITGAMRTAKEAAVTADINLLAQALESFRTKYGDYPPSRIMLNENGFYDTSSTAATTTYVNTVGADITYAQLAQRSLYYLRKFFPRANFSTSAVLYTNAASGWHDFNGDGGTGPDAGPFILEGHECLAFFLGGIPTPLGTTGDRKWAVGGFGRNQLNPFTNSLEDGNVMYSATRTTPYFEFKNERLSDVDDNDGFPGYFDNLGTNHFYAYFSAYGGQAFDPNDMNVAEPDDSGSATTTWRLFKVSNPVKKVAGSSGSGNGNDARIAISPAPNPYTSSLANALTTPVAWEKGNSFQILSAGADGLYGVGGQYAPSAADRLPLEAVRKGATAAGDMTNLNTTDATIRARERDNLTNFASGKLD